MCIRKKKKKKKIAVKKKKKKKKKKNVNAVRGLDICLSDLKKKRKRVKGVYH
eukprot:NODE_30042_length_429_cov_0.771523.p1 GENE.NODE_30042_length_429_cov_0.771523~~NODE_30042_length_429_cov_0.771523.p1  ORF type:complete len:52 (+),score=30.57 NODE_30042_length_429_cov_0.771523:167-322(+)